MARRRHRVRSQPPGSAATIRPPAVAATPPAPTGAAWWWWAGAAALVAATLGAFLPAFSAGFIRWDDPEYVTGNPLLRDTAGLAEIWVPFSHNLPQYYPLVFSSYWLEYHLWELDPLGYHSTNIALHAANAVLVLALVRGLGASCWVAMGAAAVFALHPVQVESVAWVTERKNTLSGFFSLLAFIFYLRYRRGAGTGAYAATLVTFACGLLSKTQVLSLPVLLAVTDLLLQRAGRLSRASLSTVGRRLAPMLLMSVVAAGVTAYVEAEVRVAMQERQNSVLELPAAEQRFLAGLNAPWFYLAVLFAPMAITPIFPKWAVASTDLVWLLGVLAWPVAAWLVKRWAHAIGTLPLWGMAQYLVTLAPALGFVPFTYQHNSYVAARFLYLPCIGAGVVLAALAERLAGDSGRARQRGIAVGGVCLIAVLAILTFRESVHWQSDLSFWLHAFERNPSNYAINAHLGMHYKSTRQWEAAAAHYRRAHERLPIDPSAFKSYLEALGAARGPQAVIDACDGELRAPAENPHVAYLYRGLSYEKLGRRAEAVADVDRALGIARHGSDTWVRARQARERLAPPSP